MVAPITLTVRHIRGHTFSVEVDHDADALGLKVLIWESQHIPIDQQRLVFGGKELSEGTKLTAFGVTDGAQLFLVESPLDGGAVEAVDAATAGQAVLPTAVVPPAFAPESAEEAQAARASGSFMVALAPPDEQRQANGQGYELVSDEQQSNERIAAAVALAKYVRVYCIFGFFVTLLATFECPWSGVAVIVYGLGWLGTRKLNRCMLAFPMMITFLVGFYGMGQLVFCAVKHHIEGCWIGLFVLALLLCLFHVMIFFSTCKLMCRVGKLSRDEWCNARARIISRGCCC